MRNYRRYTDQQVIDAAKIVKSIAGLLKAIGLRPVGGNFAHAKSLIQKLNIDTSHWTGQGWNKGQQQKDWNDYLSYKSCKKHLVKLYNSTCQGCKNAVWLDQPIPLEVHHIDGNKTNNNFENLTLLCCNCHALTPDWRGKKNARVV